MNSFIKIITNLSLVLTASSSGILIVYIIIPQLRHSQITGEIDSAIWLVIGFMFLLFLQCLATLFSTRFSQEKKVYRGLILALVFALPWFLIYQ